MTPAPLLDWNRNEVIAVSSRIVGGPDAKIPWEEWSSFLGNYHFFGANRNITKCRAISGSPYNTSCGYGVCLRQGYSGTDETYASRNDQSYRSGGNRFEYGFNLSARLLCLSVKMVELTRVVGDRGGFYFSHIRGEAETLLEAVAEAIRIGRETGAAVQVSHFKAADRQNWDKSARLLG